MWLTAAVSFGALIMWTALARERPVAAADPLTPAVSAREGLRRVLRVRDVWLIALIQLCVLGAAMAAVGLLPETLEDRGMSSGMAGIHVSISTWTVMVFNMVGPYISDRVGLRKPFISPFLLLSVASVTFLGVLTGAPLIIMIILYSVGVGASLPLLGALVMENERIGSLLAGSAFGFIGMVSQIGAMVFPILMGTVMDITDQY